MVLLDLFLKIQLNFQVAHINYNLRNEDSFLDAELVKKVCEKNKIKCHTYEVQNNEIPENSVQIWARELRYRFFSEIKNKEHLHFLVTAHHLDDNLETFIINLSRGSGIAGLCGIPKAENEILRPLLDLSKKEIKEYAHLNLVAFREDVTNEKEIYLRNKIRKNIVPELMKLNADFLDNFKTTLHHLAKTKNLVETVTDKNFKEISTEASGTVCLYKTQLSEKSEIEKFEILKQFGFVKTKEIQKIFQAETGSIFISNDFELLVNREELLIRPKKTSENLEQEIVLAENWENLKQRNFVITISDFVKLTFDESFSWNFDADQLSYPLKLRRLRQHDYFFPSGMEGKKKVSKFLKDLKISKFKKEDIWILADDVKVLGVLPYRQDRRCSATNFTQNIIKVKA